jgi:hypothetical protein
VANIVAAGGRTSGGSSYSGAEPDTTAASSYAENLRSELNQGDPNAAFGTRAHFNSLGLGALGDFASQLQSVQRNAGLDSAAFVPMYKGHTVDVQQQEAGPWFSPLLETTGYRIGGKGTPGGFDTGTKNVSGYYLTDKQGKLTGIDYDDTSWKSAAPMLAMMLGPLAGAIAPGLTAGIANATGLGPTGSAMAARGLIGGGMSAITGGNILKGILGGAITGGLSPAISSFANNIAGNGTTGASLLAGAGRLGVSAAMNGGKLGPMAIVNGLVDSLGKGKTAVRK